MSPPRPAVQRRPRCRRRGISTLWLILTTPIFVLLLSGIVIVGNLWLARVELENALEASALAAVQAWGRGPGGSTALARDVGVAYAAANTIGHRPVEIDPNLNLTPTTNNPNENLLFRAIKPDPVQGVPPGGNLIFGAITEETPSSGSYVFNAGIQPSHGAGGQGNHLVGQSFSQLQGQAARAFGVRAQATVPVRGPIDSLWGIQLGPKYVSAKATAFYDDVTDQARLIRVGTFISPGPNP